jgi:predicted lipid-binding transport protein (Tim44 family)
MKALKAFFAILLTFTFTTAITLEQAEAKRLGSGKSFGTSYKTAPAPSKSTTDSSAPAQQSTATAAPAKKSGLMGGMMGGLLAGGLLAALFAGGAFEGLQLMDILIMAGLAFVIFKVLRSLRQGNTMARAPAPQAAYAGAGQPVPVQPASQPAFGSAAAAAPAAEHGAPLNLPLGFSTPAFLEGAKAHYRTLQGAWNSNDLATIEEYMTAELFTALSAERASLAAAPQTEVLSLNAELVRGEQAFGKAEVSVRFSGHYRDAGEGVTEDFVDIWHLSRDYSVDNAPWFITGIQSE